MKVYRPGINSIILSLLVAAWIVFGANGVLWTKASEAFGEHQLAFAAFAVAVSALLAAFCISVSVKYLSKPVFIFLIVSAAAADWFMTKFGAIIDTDMIRNAAQTTPAEAGHLITPAFMLHMLLFAILPSLAIAYVRIEHHSFGKKLARNLSVIAPLLLVATALTLWQFPAIASTIRNNRIIQRTINPLTPIISAVKFVISSGKEQAIVTLPLDPDATLGPVIAEADKPVVTIIVAGETSRAQNFSLGGYERKTNPELEKRNVTYFRNTSACGTSTAISIPCMFSLYGRSDYAREKALAQENLLDVLGHAGIAVEWWENNTGDKNVAKRIPLRNFSVENDPRYCVNTECLDQVMVDQLGDWLDNIKDNATLVMHQLGSHGPAYYARYTQEQRLFQPDCRTAEFAKCTADEIVNAYDNTIVAVDSMLAQVIDLLQARSDRLASTMIYMSDHGESLGESGLYLHGMPYMLAPEEQTQIPFIMWFSDSYSEMFGISKTCLDDFVDNEFSHDNLFHTVLGLMNIDAKHYDPALDVAAKCKPASS